MKKRIISVILALAMCFNVFGAVMVCAEDTVPGQEDFDALRLKWYDYLTGGDSYDVTDELVSLRIDDITNQAKSVQSAMVKESEEYIWEGLSDWTVSSTITSYFGRIEDMAIAYKTYGSELYLDETLYDDIVYALNWMKAKYSSETSRYDNWYDFEIGTPKIIVNILVLMYDEFKDGEDDFIGFYDSAMERYNWSPTSYNMKDDTLKGTTATGANRAWIILIHTLRGVLTGDSERIIKARDAVSALLVYSDFDNIGKTTSGDGFFEDGSFIQHTYFAYAGGYGSALLSELVKVLYLLEGSYWEITDSNLSNIYDFVKNSFDPFLYKGQMMDMVCAREVSRYSRTSHTCGRKILYYISLLAYTTTDADLRAELIGMVKYHKENNGIADFYGEATIFEAEMMRALLEETSAYTPFSGYRQFPAMDRAVFTRPDGSYSVGIAMHSYDRTRNFEIVNNENRKGYNYSAGAVYLYNSDRNHYDGDYYPTVDYYRVPGTTVLKTTGLTHNGRSTNFAGGVDMDGDYGASAMIYMPRDSSSVALGLEARKSYFVFDDEIVLLGGATGTDTDTSVETIVENRKLNEDASNTITINGETVLSEISSTETKFEDVKYAHMEGSCDGADIGYYFPTAAGLYGAKATRTGTWKTLNTKYYTEDTKTNNYFTLRYAHGIAPTEAMYAYAMLPGKTAEQTAAYNENPDIEIIKNTYTAQAVREKNLGISGYAFYEDSYAVAGAVGADKKAVVMLKEEEGNVSVSVADPTWKNTGNITLTINAPYVSTISADDTVSVTADGEKTVLTINVNNTYGEVQKAVLTLGELSDLAEPEEETPEETPEEETPTEPAEDFYEEYTTVANTKKLDSNFEALTVGATFSKIKSQYNWSSYFGNASTQSVFADPYDAENNISQLKYSGTAYKTGATHQPSVTKMKVMIAKSDATVTDMTGEEVESGNNFYLRLRLNSSNFLYAFKFQGSNSNIGLGTNSTLSGDLAKFVPGQWLNLIIGIKPKLNEDGSIYTTDAGKQVAILKCFLSGAVTDTEDNEFENGYTVLEKEVEVAGGIFADNTGRQYQFYTEGAETNSLRYYTDNVYYYLPGSLTTSLAKTEDVSVTDPIEVTFNNDINIKSAIPENVKFVAYDGSEVEAGKVEVDPANLKKATITPASALKGSTEYKIKFETSTGAITDFVENIAQSVYFTTEAAALEEITALEISSEGELSQGTNNLSAVTFTASPTPDKSSVDMALVKWYVNGEYAGKTGESFSFTPEAAGEYVICAKTDSGVESGSITVVVEQSPYDTITALEIITTDETEQISDFMSEVAFTLATTPEDNVDISNVEWYVNDVKFKTGDADFSYTPEAVGAYIVKAVSGNVVSNEVTISVTDPILVSSIAVSPAQITVWRDFGEDITAKAIVSPATATYQTVKWASDNEAVAAVDEATGKITITGEGTANITAVSTDGSNVTSNAMMLTVTPAKNRAENQKLNIDKVGSKETRIDIDKYIALPENVGEGQIALWADNAKGAFSITVDDSLEYDFDKWISWKEKYGFPATFFVYTKEMSDFSEWQRLIDNGMDVQSHTQNHYDNNTIAALSTAQHIYEYQKPIEVLSTLNGRDNANVVAYSYGAGNENISRQFHIAARGTSGLLNKSENVNYNWVGSQSMKGSLNILYTEARQTSSKTTLEGSIKSLYDSTGYYKSYGKSYYGGWMVVHSHGLNTSKLANADLKADYIEKNPEATEEELAALKFGTGDVLEYVFENFLKPASDAGEVWVDTFANVAKYGQERDTATLNIISSTENEIVYSVTDRMDDTIFNYPLTVKFKVDSSWDDISVSAGEFEVVEEDGAKYVFVKTVPDSGEIRIINTPVMNSTLNVRAIDGTIVSEGMVDPGEWGNMKTASYTADTEFTLTAKTDGEGKFMYWKDSATGRIISKEETVTFVLGSGKNYIAVFTNGDIYVSFKNANNQILAEGYASTGIKVPENPYLSGYKFDGWYTNNTKQTFAAGEVVSGLEKDTVYNSGYVKDETEYTVEITDANGTVSSKHKYNDKVSCNAALTDASGAGFVYWMRDGKIVSYSAPYSFYVSADSKVTAVYASEAAEEKVIITITASKADDKRIAFFSERNVDLSYTVIENGILMGTNADMTLENASTYEHKATALSNGNSGQFTVRKRGVASGDTYYGRAYLIYTDGDTIYTVYSDAAAYTME